MNDPNESFVNINNYINYSWILDTQTKSDVLLIDSRSKMDSEIGRELINNLLGNPY